MPKWLISRGRCPSTSSARFISRLHAPPERGAMSGDLRRVEHEVIHWPLGGYPSGSRGHARFDTVKPLSAGTAPGRVRAVGRRPGPPGVTSMTDPIARMKRRSMESPRRGVARRGPAGPPLLGRSLQHALGAVYADLGITS